MECLEKVNKHEADFLAVDPEDMYVAFHMDNEDFSVFSEIRTVEEPDGIIHFHFILLQPVYSIDIDIDSIVYFFFMLLADFRYEGIMLVHKSSDIKSLNDLQGKKSCHTGYGRNVGYKIPITKLRKHGVLQLATESSLTSIEKELKGLSELFNQSCLVGSYSSNDDLNRSLSMCLYIWIKNINWNIRWYLFIYIFLYRKTLLKLVRIMWRAIEVQLSR